MSILASNGNIGIDEATPSEKIEVNWNITAGDNNCFLLAFNSTGDSQFFGKKHGTESILGAMEIENTT